MFVFSGIMITIKSIDRHIGHENSVGVCFPKRLRIASVNRHNEASSSPAVREQEYENVFFLNKFPKSNMRLESVNQNLICAVRT